MKRSLSQQQESEVIDLYFIEKLDCGKIALIYNVNKATIASAIKRQGLKLRTRTQIRKYYLKEDIFDNIDTEEKAYWLGFLYADGNVANNASRIRLSLAENDLEILEKFSIFIFGEIRVKKYIRQKHIKGQNMVYVDVCSEHIASILKTYGLIPNKTFKLTFPMFLNKNLISHFIRGYFDGDYR